MKIGYCAKKILMGMLLTTGKQVGRDLGGIIWVILSCTMGWGKDVCLVLGELNEIYG
jgi:hypothetical protein